MFWYHVPMPSTADYTFTDFLRAPKQVAEAADDVRCLVIHRRNAPDLVLARADRYRYEVDGAAGFGRVLSAIMAEMPETTASKLVLDAFPWSEFLTDTGRVEFAAALARALQVGAEIDSLAPAGQVVTAWKATAAIQADPNLTEALTRPIPVPDGQAVPEP